MNCSLLKAAPVAAVVAVLAATAAGASSAPLPAALLSSQPVLWIAANVIVVWLVSSYRNHTTAAASAGHGEEVNALMHASLYPSTSTGHGAFDGAAVGTETGVVAPVAKRKTTREARAARRSGERPRERKVAAAAGEEKPRAFAAESKPVEEWASTVVAAAEAKPADGEEERPSTVVAVGDAKTDGGLGDDDDSMDSMWQSILQRGAARPVAARKSDTWAAAERPRLERLAETAVARREMRKSATAINMSPPPSPHHAAAMPPASPGWRTRDVLVTANDDELLRRAESLIRRHHEQLRLQRKESEQRQALERQTRRPAPPPPSLIRV